VTGERSSGSRTAPACACEPDIGIDSLGPSGRQAPKPGAFKTARIPLARAHESGSPVGGLSGRCSHRRHDDSALARTCSRRTSLRLMEGAGTMAESHLSTRTSASKAVDSDLVALAGPRNTYLIVDRVHRRFVLLHSLAVWLKRTRLSTQSSRGVLDRPDLPRGRQLEQVVSGVRYGASPNASIAAR
jgi:hypothetical protein